jgi:hypothetical protein
MNSMLRGDDCEGRFPGGRERSRPLSPSLAAARMHTTGKRDGIFDPGQRRSGEAGRGPSEKEGLFALIAGEPGRPLELHPGFGEPAGPEQEIPLGRR